MTSILYGSLVVLCGSSTLVRSLGRLYTYLDILPIIYYNILVNKEIAFLLLCVKREGNSPPFLLRLRRSLERLSYYIDKTLAPWYNKVSKEERRGKPYETIRDAYN